MAVTVNRRSATHSTSSTTVADLLERVLDKGVVVAGDIRVKLVEVELLTVEIRLLICSVDKAVEMGLDWWRGNPAFDTGARGSAGAHAPPDAPASKAPDQIPDQAPDQIPDQAPDSASAATNAAFEQRLARLEARLAQSATTPEDST
ncbi:gas vesicle protein GvpJ [uncultured Thiohalocapsa sp.]|uniref:gas vesicle protein n=1 Tax=uncultured Thiohalocapsa sp. TaxID=768990 RepID=UPI0025CEAEA5|nr:gas vesicle protein GvpJ [uncultured Thiohalocapsa sp.]